MPGKFLKDTTIIYSYPRSGLHLLIVGLYMLDGNNVDLPYDEIWASNKIPFQTHSSLADCFSQATIPMKYERHILLLRNPCSHYSSVEPDDRIGGKNRAAKQVGVRHPDDINWDAGTSWIAATVKQFDRWRPWKDQVEMFPKRTDFPAPRIQHVHRGTPGSKKMVVYYEDLVQDKKTLLEVADFIGIKYDTVGHQPGLIDFDFIRQNAKRLYLEKGWVPSNKIILKEEEKKELLDKVRGAIGDDETFDKYFKRYT